ncbi:MAG: alpha/beta hydrolase [Lachnospiraceae bacterium]|nr:alpha/beta hydrolase [Lachnospiraceae bacterium]
MPQIPDRMIPLLRSTMMLFRDQNEVTDPIKMERLLMGLSGEVMEHFVGGRVKRADRFFGEFKASELTPSKGRIPGSVLYLHGGGYCTGGLEYATWFGKLTAATVGARTLCPAYRLAPENPYPAAVEDALKAYRYLLETYPEEKIVLFGESAGGGLCYALCLKLKEEGLPQPEGIVAASPWTDLTLSGESYGYNKEKDPSLNREKLKLFAESYGAGCLREPCCSPLFGDLSGLPESRIYVGGNEILLDDAVWMQKALEGAGCSAVLTVAEEMWHVYLFYNLRKFRGHILEIAEFLRGKLA